VTTFFSAGCFVGALAFVALVVYVHGVRTDLDRLATPLSEFFAGPTRGAMLLAYLFLSAGLACGAAKLLTMPQTPIVPFAGTASAILIALAAASVIPTALTTRAALDVDTRTERSKTLHRLAAHLAFAAIVVAMLVYSALAFPSAHRDQRALRTIAILVSVFAASVFVVSLQMPPGSPYYGIVQKLLVCLVVIWMLLIAAV